MRGLLPGAVCLLLLSVTVAALNPSEPEPQDGEPRSGIESLLGLDGDQLFARLGVPSNAETLSGQLETWSFADGALQVTLIADQVVKVDGRLPDDFEPTPRPETGLYQGQRIGEAALRIGAPREVLIGSSQILVRFADDREVAVVGPEGRIAW